MKNGGAAKWAMISGLAAVATLLVVSGLKSNGAEVRRRAETKTFMRVKMAWSQSILEGLTLEKFDVVSKNAIRMRDLTQSNQWFVVRQPDYLAATTNFQKSVDGLYLAAVDKNLGAATEAYTRVINQCVECHRLVRVEQRKNAPALQK
jgi:hypothetical protein